MEKTPITVKRDILLFAGLCGISAHASLFSVTADWVPLSMFPLLTLLLSGFCGYKSYAQSPNSEGTNGLVVATFIIGVLGYSAYARADHPELGSNFLMLLIAMGLALWVFFRAGIISVKGHSKTES